MEKEYLNLSSLKSAEGLVLPEKIGLNLDLSSLSLDELKELSTRIHQVIDDRKFEDLVKLQEQKDGGKKI